MTHLPLWATRVFNTPLLVEPRKMEVIMRVVEAKLKDGSVDARFGEERRPEKPYTVQNGVAVLPIMGTLVQRASGLDAMSGLTSYQSIDAMLTQAAADPLVERIMLDMDSPGGETAGLFALTDKIHTMRGQGKPIWAYANDMAASAAYAIAAATERIVMPRTGLVGSIGVIAEHVDESGLDEQMGLKYTPIFAGAHKADANPHEPLTAQGRDKIQALVDGVYEVFTSSVAAYRGLDVQAVRDTEAGIYMGQAAVDAGLADDIGTFEGALAALSGVARPTQFATAHAGKERNMDELKRRAAAFIFGTPVPEEAQPEDVATLEGQVAELIQPTTVSSGAAASLNIVATNAERDELQRLRTEMSEGRLSQARAAIDNMVLENRILPTGKQPWLDLAASLSGDARGHQALLAALATVQPLGLVGENIVPDDTQVVAAGDRSAELAAQSQGKKVTLLKSSQLGRQVLAKKEKS